MMTLSDFLTSILSGSFALGPAVFFAVEYLKIFQNIPSDRKRIVVAVICGVLGVVTYGVAITVGVLPEPLNKADTLNAIWTYGVSMGFSAFTSSSLIHGSVALKSES